jgi:hypothetical protein
MLYRVCVLALLLLLGGVLQAQTTTLRAELDRDVVRLGETAQLTLSLDGRSNAARPDLSVLGDELSVLNVARQVGGDLTRGEWQTSWRITIEPAQQGVFTIPALEVDGMRSQPLTLTVRPPPAPGEERGEVFVDVRLQPEQGPYRVGQQIQLNVALYHAVPLASGQLSEPQPDGATLERMGEDSLNEARRGGELYRVVERQYALIPERGGRLEIPAVRFSGRTGSRAQTFFGEMGRPISASSRALEIDVQEPASGEPDLPARRLSLLDNLSDQALEIRVGEAISREITILAEGVHADRLPELTQDVPDGLRGYADQPTRETSVERGWLQARLQQRLAMVAMQAGDYRLPAVEVDWFNVATQQLETARLPALDVTVLPDPAAAAPSPPGAAEGEASDQVQVVFTAAYWPWLTAGFAGLWLLTLFAWWWHSRASSSDEVEEEVNAATRYARRKLSRAAARGDTAEVQDALMLWSRAESLPCRSLAELAETVSQPELADAIRALDRHRFGARGVDWQAPEVFRRPPAKLCPDPEQGTQGSPLPPLYPS